MPHNSKNDAIHTQIKYALELNSLETIHTCVSLCLCLCPKCDNKMREMLSLDPLKENISVVELLAE